ncbi:MAG: hypothetical protein AAGD25_03490 [Cyanobacteria bacterium P01_F01_bin.150]
MTSGIFAVINLGQLRLYVGEMHTFKKRWEPLLRQLSEGRCSHKGLQAEWDKCQGERKVTFHTLADLKSEKTLLGYKQFVKDVQASKARA